MNMSYFKNSHGKETILLETLWTALQSNEFVLSKLNDYYFNIFPKVFGFCGRFYVVEAVSISYKQQLQKVLFSILIVQTNSAFTLTFLL